MTLEKLPFTKEQAERRDLNNLHLSTDWGQLDCLGDIKGIGGEGALEKLPEFAKGRAGKVAKALLDATPAEGGGAEYTPNPDEEGKRDAKSDPGLLQRIRNFFGGGKKQQNTDPVRGDDKVTFDRSIPISDAKKGLIGNPGSSENVRPAPETIDRGTVPASGNTRGNIDPAPNATP